MVRIPLRRLLRAVVLATLLFLLVDASTGFAVAAQAPAEDSQEPQTIMPMPGPGDKATYIMGIKDVHVENAYVNFTVH